MKLNTILLVASAVLGVVLVSLTGMVIYRRHAASSEAVSHEATVQTSRKTQTAANSSRQAEPVQNPEESAVPPRLLTEAAKFPESAIEGVRSPTPIPPSTLTLTEAGAHPPFVTLTGDSLTIINKTAKDQNVYMGARWAGEGEYRLLVSVPAGGKRSAAVPKELVEDQRGVTLYAGQNASDAFRSPYRAELMPSRNE